MGKDDKKRQKKLEKRSARRKEKKHTLIREQNHGLGDRLTTATKYPVLHSWATEDLWRQGMGYILLSRELPGGMVAVVAFLVDRYCLGVKNALADILGRAAYEDKYIRKLRSQFAVRELSPSTVRKFVEDAVAYAQKLGFPPHADYQKAKLIFGDIDPSQSTEELEFGKDGKPFYIAGPHDTPDRVRYIMGVLSHNLGPDEFHFLAPMSGDELIRPFPGAIEGDEDWDEEDFEDES